MFYTNEIVFRGHPDKVCDQISGAILDACLEQDSNTRAGIEVCGGKGNIFITGELTTNANIDVEEITRRVLRDVGYRTDYNIIVNIGRQSPDIAQGVDTGGAGDNGMMFGYACNDTPQMLPTAMVILQRFAEEYDKLRKRDSRFLPDGKAQITGNYTGKKLKSIQTFTVCYQNTEEDREETDKIIKDLATQISSDVMGLVSPIEKFLINPTGKFLIGGFEGDSGVTGRKIVVDAYQSFSNVGGGCMNGKDPSKVDVSGAYMARRIACKEVTEKKLEWCEVQIAYAIGMASPLSIYINTDKGEIKPEPKYFIDCEPKNIISMLGMKKIRYEKQAQFGHFRQKP